MTQKEYEKKIIDMLLNLEQDTFKMLREQYTNATVLSRDFFDGAGFATSFTIPNELSIGKNTQGVVDDVAAYFPGFPGEMQIYRLVITDGKIDYLEGSTFGDTWNTDYGSADLHYMLPGKRRYEFTK